METKTKIVGRFAAGKIALALTLLLTVNMALAAAVVQIDGSGTNATGILNLKVDGILYDVEFVYDFGDDVYPSGFPFTGGNEFTANTAMIIALNDSPAETAGPEISDFYVLGADISPLPAGTVGPGATFGTSSWDSDVTSFTPDGERTTYASFSASAAVPVPAAVWLFGSAIGLLGWMRRKAS